MDSLLYDINRILGQYTANVNMVMQSTFDITARDTVKKLKAESARVHGDGPYAKNWTYRKGRGEDTVYNKAPTYRLTHLLENGHDIVRNGEKIGEYEPGEKHIQPVEEWLKDELPKRLEEALGHVD